MWNFGKVIYTLTLFLHCGDKEAVSDRKLRTRMTLIFMLWVNGEYAIQIFMRYHKAIVFHKFSNTHNRPIL